MSALEAHPAPYMSVSHTEDEAAPYGQQKSIPVDERINALNMSAGMRDLLALVCRAREFGRDKALWGNNAFVGKAANCHEKSVPRYLSVLVEAKLVTVTVERGRRTILPTQLTRSLYLEPDERGNKLLRCNQMLQSVTKAVTPKPIVTAREQTVTHNIEGNIEDSSVVIGLRRQLAATAALLATAQSDLAAEKKKAEVCEASVQHYSARYADEVEAHQKTKAELERATKPKKVAPTKEESSAPLVALYTQWYKERSGNAEPMFDGRDGKAGKEIFQYLKGQSKTKDSAGALAGMQYVFDHWHILDYGIRKQTNLWQIKANLSTILVQIAAGRQNLKVLEAQRLQRELEPEVKHNPNPLAIPQHPDAYRYEIKPELKAQQDAEEQARRNAIIQERLAKHQQEQQQTA